MKLSRRLIFFLAVAWLLGFTAANALHNHSHLKQSVSEGASCAVCALNTLASDHPTDSSVVLSPERIFSSEPIHLPEASGFHLPEPLLSRRPSRAPPFCG